MLCCFMATYGAAYGTALDRSPWSVDLDTEGPRGMHPSQPLNPWVGLMCRIYGPVPTGAMNLPAEAYVPTAFPPSLPRSPQTCSSTEWGAADR